MANDDLELLQNFIHDLKAPLGSAKNFIDLLTVSGELNNKQKHFAHRALSNMDKMNRIITTLLEYARMEAGVELDIDVCDVLEVTEDILEMIDGNAQERQLKIQVNIAPDAQFVQADEALLESVLLNLINNAIKYNKISGDIHISSENAGEFVRVLVRDTGLGIPEQALEHIFTRFYRVETKAHMQIEGTGIGLAMVKSVIEKHGGEIAVESTLNEGSTFYFTLPHASTSSPDHNREPMDGLPDEFQEDNEQSDDRDSGEFPRYED